MTGTVAYVLLNGKVKAVEQQLASLPRGINFKGAVDYVNSLPTNAELGDTYTVKYHGTSGTVPYGAEFAWGEYDGAQQWIKLSSGEVGGGKIEMLYNGTNITVDGAVVNFKQIVDYLTVDNKFTYLLYNNMAYLTTKIDTTSSLKQVVFESSHVDGGMGKIFTITVNSSDGVTIASINHTNVANENYSNKVSSIAENDKKSTVHYPSNKAVTDITDSLKEDLIGLKDNVYNDKSISFTKPETTNAIGNIPYRFVSGHTYKIVIGDIGTGSLNLFTRVGESNVENIVTNGAKNQIVEFTATADAELVRYVCTKTGGFTITDIGTTDAITRLNADIIEILTKSCLYNSEPTWVSGGISTAGDLTTSTTRIRFSEPVYIAKGTNAYVVGDYKLMAVLRSTDGNIIDLQTINDAKTNYTASADGLLVLAIAKNDNSDLSNVIIQTAEHCRMELFSAETVKSKIEAIESEFVNNIDLTPEIKRGRYIALGNYSLGQTVDLTNIVYNQTWAGGIFECKKGDKFVLTGSGGNAARLYGFLDTNKKLLSVAQANKVVENFELKAESDGYLVVTCGRVATYSLIKVDGLNKFDELESKITSNKNKIDDINKTNIFGVGISCRYDVENMSALNVGANPLEYFYNLYDGLVSQYPEYITKIDCDTEVTENGIVRPDYMTDYPIYVYKFIPNYPSSTPDGTGETGVTRNKIFITTGTHPEYTAINGCYQVMKMLCESWATNENLEALRFDAEYYIMPCSGPYGVQHGTRTNYNGVDLNRNAPSEDWASGTQGSSTYGGTSPASEYETKVWLYYLNQINPIVYIDHHNFNVGSKYSVYFTSKSDKFYALGNNNISVMSRRWASIHSDIFGSNAEMLGYAKRPTDTGLRATYVCETGIAGCTFESCDTLNWNNGEYNPTSYQQRHTALVETLATDAFLNFLLMTLKHFCN